MGAKDIRIEPISAKDAAKIVRSIHYSGKIVQNSKIHLGVFLGWRCGGVLSYGSPMDKRRCLGLVAETPWNGMIELNRMALADWLPRNAESRALSVAARILATAYPALDWILTYADCTQCGDGAIYRAAGFWLTAVKRNTTLLRMPDGSVVADKTLNNHIAPDGARGSKAARAAGATPLRGFQLRYIKGLRPGVKERLTVPILPYSALDKAGARMYRGEWKTGVGSAAGGTPGIQPGGGGSIPTSTLHPPVAEA